MPFVETKAYYENTTMREIQKTDGYMTGYDIAPVEGYVLHNSTFDCYEDDLIEQQTTLISRGYSPSSCSVDADYDFEANPNEIYAKKRDDLEDNEVIY